MAESGKQIIARFYGASSMERLPTERVIKQQTERFTQLSK